MNILANCLKNNPDLKTENGASTFSTTLNANVDFFAMGAAKRGVISEAVHLFELAMREDIVLALLNLFYIRDIRGGQGEREIFRQCLTKIPQKYLENLNFLKLIPEYGRWDDVINLIMSDFPFDSDHFKKNILQIILNQLHQDLIQNENVSLLAKWIPLVNSVSNQKRKEIGKIIQKFICTKLNITPKILRKRIVELRKKIQLIEQNLSEKDYNAIDYSKIPSRAFIKYKKAFERNDKENFQSFLQDVQEGKSKIQTSCLYPHDVIQKLINEFNHPPIYNFDNFMRYWMERSDMWINRFKYSGAPRSFSDFSLDEEKDIKNHLQIYDILWSQLPKLNIQENILPVIDVSGSMLDSINKYIYPMSVSIGLGLYLAENNHGQFKNCAITFSKKPTILNFMDCMSIYDKLKLLFQNIGLNTNLQAVFDLLLKIIVENHVPPQDIPTNIIVISDMEFDHPDVGGQSYKTNFQTIQEKFKHHNIPCPKITFWNVNSRQNNVPTRSDEYNVNLVSGFSPTVIKYIYHSKTPFDAMMDVLKSKRYKPVLEVLESIH